VKKPVKSSRKRNKEPELFLNRELSWLEFNTRVLEEAEDPSVPLLDRLRFAIIVGTNFDEFVMVRVAGLEHAVLEGDTAPDLAGLTPSQQLQQIAERAHEQVSRLYKVLKGELLPALAERGVRIAAASELEAPARAALARHFRDEVMPGLTPLAVDSSRPAPLLASLSLNIAVLLSPAEGEEELRLAVVQVPARLPRLSRLPGESSSYVLLEDEIRSEMQALFPGQGVLEAAPFRLARDSELELDDEGGRDYLQVIEEELKKRRRSLVVRLEVEAGATDALVSRLASRLGVDAADVYRVPGPLDLRAFLPLCELPTLEDLREAPRKALPVLETKEREQIFDTLEARDVLLFHPYDAFDPVVDLLERAAADPDVLAIKQTLYRTSGDSPVVRALMAAAEQGKQVTVLVELMARFDEQSNIRWARRLEEAGAHVIYGIRGYKTHAKMTLVVRRGRTGIRRYVHLGTGNYNDRTARVYTDFGLMTADPAIGEDASAFFNVLTGYSDPPPMKKLAMAPTRLRERLLQLIERERRRAQGGQPALVRAKMNALVDEDLIRALYEASKAGVKVQLNVRGVCCLRPGLKGVSENIEVCSIVDRYLEHARVIHVHDGGDDEVYMSSADWMPRNLDRRIELLFPVESKEARQKSLQALDRLFEDNVKSRWLQSDGSYKRRRPGKGEDARRAQDAIYQDLQRGAQRTRTAETFEPLTSPEG
jgi:polyphosphate kinase